jgi:antitoxin ParD1/3/4
MNVSLTPELEKIISRKVKSGMYNSASEVVREALRLLEEQDRLRAVKLDALRREVQEGFGSGDAVPFDMETIKSEARKKHGSQKR